LEPNRFGFNPIFFANSAEDVSYVLDIIALIGLALIGYGLFLLFGTGWCCLVVGSIMLFGGVFLATPRKASKSDGQ
jgi:hypothetical protein